MSTPTAAIILSRQALRPCGRTPWVKQVRAVVAALRQRPVRLLTSVGLQTWELVAAAAALSDIPQTLFLPESERAVATDWFDTLGLDQSRDRIRFIGNNAADRNRRSVMVERDRTIIETADRLFPIAVRPEGTMDRLIEQARLDGRGVVDDFRIVSSNRAAPLKYEVKPIDHNPQLAALGDRYLIHWTRTANHAWPGERLIDYYRAILESDTYPRTALDTLRHILTTRILLASPRHMPNRTPTVSFTSLSPTESLSLMRWRARYREMSFEPYGIGIERTVAETLGIRPVQYSDCTRAKRLPLEEDPWLRQSLGIRTDWRQEQEYRLRGNLDLTQIGADRMIAFCYRLAEAQKTTALTGVRAVAVLSE